MSKLILGSGIAGLSAAHYLLNKFPLQTFSIYEATNRTGGWIRSNILPNGVVFEQGPRTIRPKGIPGMNTLQLLSELNLEDKIIPICSTHPAAKNRMIYANGKLCTLPSSIQDIFKTLPPFSKPLLCYFMQDLIAKPEINEDEPIYNFVERRFGRDIADYAISPLICGICAGDAKEISVKFLMKSIFEKEQKYGSVSKGFMWQIWENRKRKKVATYLDDDNLLIELSKKERWSVYSLNGGLETLPKTLEKKLAFNGVDICLEKRCKQITFKKDLAILDFDGCPEQKVASHVISSIPAQNLADLVQKQHPILTTLLRSIPQVTVAVANLHYNRKLDLEDAFGFLVPPSENIPILGVVFDSCCFPNADNTVLTVMMGGHWFNKLFGTTPKEEFLLSTAIEQIRDILDIDSPPDHTEVNILRDCIPQYIVGHEGRVRKIEDYIKTNRLPISVCGSSYYGVGVNDVILSSKNVVDNLI